MIKITKFLKWFIIGAIIISVFTLSGCNNNSSGSKINAKIDGDIQKVTSKVTSNGYEAITVQKGIPVVWTIQVGEGVLTSCNNEIIIENYDIQKKLAVGDNIIEFTPTKSGIVPFTCWMNMIGSEINVLDNLEDK
ncbi:MAG: heavy metal transporter [Bacillales bacterium]|nr:heavy metal transporter [Bacillales bacterium]